MAQMKTKHVNPSIGHFIEYTGNISCFKGIHEVTFLDLGRVLLRYPGGAPYYTGEYKLIKRQPSLFDNVIKTS